jgi:hypothetical protein
MPYSFELVDTLGLKQPQRYFLTSRLALDRAEVERDEREADDLDPSGMRFFGSSRSRSSMQRLTAKCACNTARDASTPQPHPPSSLTFTREK